jgi:hypothetical protein
MLPALLPFTLESEPLRRFMSPQGHPNQDHGIVLAGADGSHPDRMVPVRAKETF